MDQVLQTKMISDAVTRILQSEDAEDTIHNVETGEDNVILFGKVFTPDEANNVILSIAASMRQLVNQTSMINQAEFHCALADVTREIAHQEDEHFAKPPQTNIPFGRGWMSSS